MTYAKIIALIFSISLELGVPADFTLSIAVTRGATQTVARWDTEENIRSGIERIKELSAMPKINTWWGVAVAWHSGDSQFKKWPTEESLNYADRVMAKYNELTDGNIEVTIRGKI